MRRRPAVVLAVVAALAAGCTATSGERRATGGAAPPPTTAVPSAPVARATATAAPAAPSTAPAPVTRTAPPPAPPSLPRDLRNARLPAGVCQADAPAVRLRDGRAKNTSRTLARTAGTPVFYVNLGEKVDEVRADLTGDGVTDAAVVIACEGYGGGNHWEIHVLVVTPGPDGLRLLGDLMPDDHGVGTGGADVTVRNGRLRTNDKVYRPTDPRCCATGDGYTEWRWQGSRFVQSAAGVA